MRAPDRVALPWRVPVLLFLALTLAVAAWALDTAASTAATPHRAAQDPRLTRQLYVNQDSQAYQAAQADPRFAKIGNTPQALWVSSDWMPLSTVQDQTASYAAKANAADRTPFVAIYAIPDRDCGGQSAGGYSARDYRVWVTRLAAGLKDQHAIAILEPDALGLLGSCAGQGNRTGLLAYATRTLSAADVWVYIDAGHSSWVDPVEMAKRLVASGVDDARGFSTDVASFVRTPLERAYATAINAALVASGHDAKHYLIDTSRNGGGQSDGNDWCNPLDARLGRAPKMIGRTALDGFVWVKSPGESDGTCNGGPPAGQWWASYALRLMG